MDWNDKTAFELTLRSYCFYFSLFIPQTHFALKRMKQYVNDVVSMFVFFFRIAMKSMLSALFKTELAHRAGAVFLQCLEKNQ